jgi:hypothetical protein
MSRTAVAAGLVAVIAMGAGAKPAAAADPPPPPQAKTPLCADPAHHQFDFWIGDWQVFNMANGKLVGFTKVEKQLKDCAIVQKLDLIDDEWRRSELQYRLSGIGVSSVQGDRWSTYWVDDYGGNTFASGQLQKDGSMAFETSADGAGKSGRAIWRPNADGTVESVHYKSSDGGKTWQLHVHWLYRPNH